MIFAQRGKGGRRVTPKRCTVQTYVPWYQYTGTLRPNKHDAWHWTLSTSYLYQYTTRWRVGDVTCSHAGQSCQSGNLIRGSWPSHGMSRGCVLPGPARPQLFTRKRERTATRFVNCKASEDHNPSLRRTACYTTPVD